MEKPSRAINIHLGADLKARWKDYCAALGKSPGAAIKEAIEEQLAKVAAAPQSKTYYQIHETPSAVPKVRFEILLTESERRAIRERSTMERCSMRRWIVDACRVGLTHQPQFSMSEIDVLGESNYQMLAIGRNLNQIARQLNKGEHGRITVEQIENLSRIIDKHTDLVSAAIAASLERWDLGELTLKKHMGECADEESPKKDRSRMM